MPVRKADSLRWRQDASERARWAQASPSAAATQHGNPADSVAKASTPPPVADAFGGRPVGAGPTRAPLTGGAQHTGLQVHLARMGGCLDKQALTDDAKAIYEATKGGLSFLGGWVGKGLAGAGTDEAALFGVLERYRSPGDIAQLGHAYAKAHGRDLRADVLGEFSARWEPHRTEEAQARLSGQSDLADAVRLHGMMEGFGVDSAGVIDLLSSRSPPQRRAIERAYQNRYDEPLRDRVASETSGSKELRALGALDGDHDVETLDPLGPYQPVGTYADTASGLKLKAIRGLATLGLTRGIVQGEMLKKAGIQAFRELDLSHVAPSATARLPQPPSSDSVGKVDLDAVARAGASERGTIAALHQAYLDGSTTPTEVAKAFIKAANASEAASEGGKALNPFVDVGKDQVLIEAAILKAAAASTQRYAEGRSLGPLDGIPVPVKDQLDVEGMATAAGTSFLKAPADADAHVVANLRAAGALLVGKTVMHELGFGTSGINPHDGTPRNPYDLTRTSGGSSGGSAAAVSARLTPAAVGSDAGGSTRIPAALTGIVGLKPTQGRMSQRGNYALAPSLQQAGPMGATARDVALLYGVMAGHDPKDPTSVKAPVQLDGFDRTDLTGVTIGIDAAWNQHADPDVVAATEKTVARLKDLGATIKPISINGLNTVGAAQMVAFTHEVAKTEAAHRKTHGSAYSDEVRLNFALSDALTDKDYEQFQRVRTLMSDEMESVLDEVDMVLSPMTASVAPEVPDSAVHTGLSNLNQHDKLARYATLANITGLPALTFPGGLSDEGLPVGIQLIGRAFEEASLLRVANAHETTFDMPPPTVTFGSD
jgi:Asp-tRNA(Asn)/Glu-tRNA(Gln) amidotransferase A subunit family amidase